MYTLIKISKTSPPIIEKWIHPVYTNRRVHQPYTYIGPPAIYIYRSSFSVYTTRKPKSDMCAGWCCFLSFSYWHTLSFASPPSYTEFVEILPLWLEPCYLTSIPAFVRLYDCEWRYFCVRLIFICIGRNILW